MKLFLHSTFKARALPTIHLGCALFMAAGAAQAQTTILSSPAPIPSAPVVATAQSVPTTAENPPSPIGININGRNVAVDPTPVLRSGVVFVPIRGVLENLGASLTYDPATSRIDILQSRKRYSLKLGDTAAAVENSVITLSSPPIMIAGRVFVPLRDLAQLFGYRVEWLPSTQVVAIFDKPNSSVVVRPPVVKPPATGSTPSGSTPGANTSVAVRPPVAIPAGSTPVVATIDHRALLQKAGRFGIAINFHDANSNDVDILLDSAKKAGATLVKFRFDWNVLEPTKGSAFQWPLYDRVVAGARKRGLSIVGVLGNTTRWATLYPRSENPNEWRNSPPKKEELPAWDNYVRRVVGRYGNDVHAWQVWENPATYNFRSVAKDYRIVARRAIEVARIADPRAVLFAGEPGGVNLGFIEDLRRNGLLALVNGVSLYPVSQWQPGVVANAEEMVLPISTLAKDPQNRDKDYWVHGLSRLSLDASDLTGPRADAVFNTKDLALRKKLAQNFTPAAQADYLVRAMTLALASGTEKIFWGNLRDEATYDRVDPVNSLFGGGLLKRDGTPRPSYAAYSNLTKLIGGKKYIGALASGPRAIVLVFENEGEVVGVAWSTPGQEGQTKLALNPSRDPGQPGAIYLQTTANSRVLDASGEEVGDADQIITLTQRPLWISNLSFKVAQDLRGGASGVLARLASGESSAPDQESLRAVFAPGAEAVEDGLYWRKYLGFRGAAHEFVSVGATRGLQTTFSRDVLNPAAGFPSIYLDVSNDYLFFARGAGVRVSVEVKRPVKTEGPFAAKGGFNLQYDSPNGFKTTPWQVVEGGEGWANFVIDIPDASFANRDGFDLLINTWGAKQDLVFRSVALQRTNARVAEAGSTPGASGH